MAIDGGWIAGESQPFQFTITDEDGAPVNLTGAALRYSLARETGGGPLFTKTEADMTLSGSGPHIITFALDPADTASMGGAHYSHELQIIDGSGNCHKPVWGLVTIYPSINDPTP